MLDMNIGNHTYTVDVEPIDELVPAAVESPDDLSVYADMVVPDRPTEAEYADLPVVDISGFHGDVERVDA